MKFNALMLIIAILLIATLIATTSVNTPTMKKSTNPPGFVAILAPVSLQCPRFKPNPAMQNFNPDLVKRFANYLTVRNKYWRNFLLFLLK
jgi:hypothetical protein